VAVCSAIGLSGCGKQEQGTQHKPKADTPISSKQAATRAGSQYHSAKVPYYATPDFTPIWTTGKAIIDTIRTVGAFRLTDQHEHIITQDSVRNTVHLVNFFFTSCPGICPTMTTNIKQVYEMYRGNTRVKFLSHSVTPDIDTAPLLRKYAAKYGISGHQWHFLRGKKDEIYRLARMGYFIEEEAGYSKDSKEFLHSENIILVDKHGRLRGIYNGTLRAEIPRMIEDIGELLREE
jgi:protein SCO1